MWSVFIIDLFDLIADIVIILKHIDVNSLAFKKIHFKNCQVIIDVSLNYLAAIILEHFIGVCWRFETPYRVVFGVECGIVLGLWIV